MSQTLLLQELATKPLKWALSRILLLFMLAKVRAKPLIFQISCLKLYYLATITPGVAARSEFAQARRRT